MKRNAHIFPVNPRAKATVFPDGGNKIENEIIGGMSYRDHIAIELFCALAANVALVGKDTLDQMRGIAIDQANKFCEDLGEN